MQRQKREALAVRRHGAALTAAGMLEAERQFRRIIGYRDLAKIALAIQHDGHRPPASTPTEEAATLATA